MTNGREILPGNNITQHVNGLDEKLMSYLITNSKYIRILCCKERERLGLVRFSITPHPRPKKPLSE